MKKYLPNYQDCFVCGDKNNFGLKRRFYVEIDGADDTVRDEVFCDITFTEEYQGFKGVVHGGIVTALIDEAMGWASTLKTHLMYVTGDLKISFVKPVPVGEKLLFRARMLEDKKKITLNEGIVTDSAGNVLVKATGRFFALGSNDTERVMEYLTFDSDTYNLFGK